MTKYSEGTLGRVKDIRRSILPFWFLLVLLPTLIAKMAVSPWFDFVSLSLLAAVTVLVLWCLQTLRIRLSRIEWVFCYLVFITGFFGVALFPINLGPFTLFPFRLFLLALWILFVMRALLQRKVVLPIGKVMPYIVFLGFWVAYAVISLGWAASKVDAIRHLIFLFMGASTIFFAAFYFRNVRDLDRLYWIWFAVFCGMILLGFWEHLTGHHLPVSGFYGETRARFMFRPTGVFHNANDYATFLALSIPFALGVIRYARRGRARLIGVGSALAGFYLIVVTGSRANILAVLLETAFLALFLTNLTQKTKVAVAATTCLAVALLLLPGPVHEFFSEVAGQLRSIPVQMELGTGSMAVRANLARNGLVFLYSTAGFGVGAGNAEYWMANFTRYDTAGILNPHNWWLEILINYGVLVFAGYLLFYLGLIRGLWRAWSRTPPTQGMICETLLLSLVGFALATVSPSSIMAFTPQWLLLALAVAFLNWWRRSQPREVA